MNTGIDFLAENLLGALHSQCRNLLAQSFTGIHRLLLCFSLGCRNDLVLNYMAGQLENDYHAD